MFTRQEDYRLILLPTSGARSCVRKWCATWSGKIFFSNCILLCRDSIISLNSLSACCFHRKSSRDVTSTSLPWYVTITRKTPRKVSICADSGIADLREEKPCRIFAETRIAKPALTRCLRVPLALAEHVFAYDENQHRVYQDNRSG